MISPRTYAACNEIDLHEHYNVPEAETLTCEFCLATNKTTHLSAYRQFDQTWWYFCPQCGFAGTGLDYLAAKERISPIRKLYRLCHAGELDGISEKLLPSFRNYKESTDRLRTEYDECRRFRSCQESSQLQYIENLDHYFHSKKYRIGERKTFEQWFHPCAVQHGTSGSRLFHGRNWDRITAIPLYDMPLRMSSILFVNGHPQSKRSIAIKRLGPQLSGTYSFDPGYLATSQILSQKADNDPIVISSDWLQVLRFQANIWHQEHDIAPIVAWFPQNPTSQKPWCYRWSFFKDVPKVFWSYPDDTVNLREACLQNAMVSHAYYRPESRLCHLPDGLLDGAIVRSVRQDAMIWHQALCLYLGHDQETMESRLSTLQLPQQTLEQFLRFAPNHLREKITSQFFTTGSMSRYVDNIMVVSSHDGWHQAAKNPHLPSILLSSARCIVDRVLYFGDKEPMYQGRILIKDESHSFLVNESEIEKNVVGFLRRICMENRSKYHPVINTSPEKLLKLIRAHADFQVTHMDSGFGWNDKSFSLSLPNLTVSDHTVLDSELNLDSGPLASLTLKHSMPLTREDWQVLQSFQEETPYLLAILVSMMPVLFAPAYRMEAPQTVVVGTNLELLEPIFRLLGLPVSLKSISPTLTDFVATHRCPYLVRLPSQPVRSKRMERLSWIDLVGLHGCGYISSSLLHGLSRMCYGRANLLFLPRGRFYRWLRGVIPEVFLKCFLVLLRHFSRYVLEVHIASENWNADMIEEGIRFLHSEMRLPVHQGTIIDGYYDPSPYFCDYVNLLRRKELLKMEESEGMLTIRINELAECFREHIGFFDFDQIKAILEHGMILRNYDPVEHRFQLDSEPFTVSLRRLERIYTPYIRK